MTRAGYGADEIYTRMAWESLPEWRALSDRAGLPIFHETGVLFFAPAIDDYFRGSIEAHRRLGHPIEALDGATLRRRFPMIDFTGIEAGLYEPRFGALMARRAVQTLVAEFVRAGGTYSQARVLPPTGDWRQLPAVFAEGRTELIAERFVFACGPWLGKLFPDLLGRRIFPTRQEVFFFAPEARRLQLHAGPPARLGRFQRRRHLLRLPGSRGPRLQDRPRRARRRRSIPTRRTGPIPPRPWPTSAPSWPAASPRLADRPLTEARVCQYENSSNGDFLIDRHPRMGERDPRRRRQRPRLQARPGGGALRGGSGAGAATDPGAEVQPCRESGAGEQSRSLSGRKPPANRSPRSGASGRKKRVQTIAS